MTDPERSTEVPGEVRVYPSKRLVNVLDLRPWDIELIDIAHGLDRICRYNGHIAGFLSVAEHSLHVVTLLMQRGAPAAVQRQGLLHDAAEAYVGDMVGPLKHLPAMAAYRSAEQRVEAAIAARFDLPTTFDPLVKWADQLSGSIERNETRDRSLESSPGPGGTVRRFLAAAARLGVA